MPGDSWCALHCRSCGYTSHFLISYVDNQLRHSRRFDAEGIRRDYPELFVPFPHRRTSSSNSLSSLSSNSTHRDDVHVKEEGQLRYWTSRMCNHSPHLFDFVITVSDVISFLLILDDDKNDDSSGATAQCYLHHGYSNA
jgi:hypothetical protein